MTNQKTQTDAPQDEDRLEAPARPDGERGRVRLTINDIARLADVSKKTVSRVINNSALVKGETRERVDAVIREHGFKPDPQARGLAFRRAFLIGLIYDNPNPQYVVNMQQGVLDALAGSGFELLIRPSDRASPRFLDDMRDFVERQRLSGVVMPPSMSEDQRLADLLTELDCPYVRIASIELDAPERMVVTRDHEGAAAAGRHLAALGHSRIAHISGPRSFRSSHQRRQGFIGALAEHGLTLAAELDRAAGYTFETGLACARELLALSDRPTAIFTGNDEMAVGVYTAAHEIGLDIPGDLSVVGYDDAPIASRVWPALTSVRLPIRDMGRIATAMLLAERAEGADAKPKPLAEFTPTLVERASTAKPR